MYCVADTYNPDCWLARIVRSQNGPWLYSTESCCTSPSKYRPGNRMSPRSTRSSPSCNLGQGRAVVVSLLGRCFLHSFPSRGVVTRDSMVATSSLAAQHLTRLELLLCAVLTDSNSRFKSCQLRIEKLTAPLGPRPSLL